jgi:mono/diheme cytochrome c family protein
MNRFPFTAFGVAAFAVVVSAQTPVKPSTPAIPATPPKAGASAKPAPAAGRPQLAATHSDAQTDIVKQYCAGCHSDKGKAGQLSLASYDAAKAEQHPEITEKMIRKLRAGMMPPPGARRPEPAVLDAFVGSLESKIDAAAALRPNPGHRTFQRLSRAEYGRSVAALLDVDVDVYAFLPPDTISFGFDNMSEVQGMSPTLMEGYLRAASKISSVAVGDKTASPTEFTVKVPRTESQMRHVEGTPWGTRGGVSLTHTFPADGDYTFRVMLHSIPTGELYGSVSSRNEQIEVAINGERVALIDINYHMDEKDPNGMNITTPRIHVKAGPQHVTAAFIQRFEAPVDDLVAPIDYTLADTEVGDAVGITTLPHLRDFSITGPFSVTGVSDTPSRRKIFICRPLAPAEEIPCARKIVTNLVGQAYRRTPSGEDIESLMTMFERGAAGGKDDARKSRDLEAGVRAVVQAVLASPHFLFRLEEVPATARPGQNYRITDLDLASRLSYFLWATGPDAELLKAANGNTLHLPAVLDRQVKRMLADKRADALSTRFASQWLRLQDVDKIKPDALLFPSYNNQLAEAYKRETELFFDSIVREDRNILDLFTADYTFVNERTAKVYRIPNIVGDDFRRVTVTDENRRGLLGHGSILLQTSIADRTSPVLRGKWIMEVLLGSPPPPAPPNVPPLDDTKASNDSGNNLSVRQRMEEHRKNPTCASCHRVIDPLGLSLDNFDVVGAWRIKDNGVPVDTTGKLYDGTELSGPVSLRQALVTHSDALIRAFTENLMAYALGRRVEYFDQPAVRTIVRKAGQNENRFSSFVMGIVTSPAFQMSKSEPVTTTVEQ